MSASRVIAAALVIALPSTALAGPLTAGVALGLAQAKTDAEGDATSAHGIFGRLRLGNRLGLQLELAKIGGPENGNDIRSASALLVVDLLDSERHRIVPMFLAGAGVDRQRLGSPIGEDLYDVVVNGQHVEGGFGIEYRSPHGLTIGLDLRVGSREIDDSVETGGADAGGGSTTTGGVPRGRTASLIPCDPSMCETETVPGADGGFALMPVGEYRSARIVIGVQF